MKDENYIDDLFRDGLEDFKMEPSEKSWNSLESDLAKKRASRKRRNGFFLFSLALLLLISYTSYKIFTPGKSSEAINKKAETNITEKKNSASTQSTTPSTSAITNSENISGNKPVASSIVSAEKSIAIAPTANVENNSSIRPKTNINKKENIIPASQKSENAERNVAANNKIKNTSSAETIIPEKNSNIDNKVITHNTASDPTINPDNKETIAAPAAIAPVEIAATTTPVENNSNGRNDNVATEKNSSAGKSEEKSTTPSSATTENSTKEIAPATVPTVAVQTEINNNEVSGVKKEAEKSSAEPTTSEPSKQPQTSATDYTNPTTKDSTSLLKKIASHISAEVYYSPDYVMNRLKVNSNYTGTASQDINDYDNQKAAFSYSTGIHLGYDIGSHWKILSGVSYSTFAQTAVYNTVNVVSDSVYQDVHGHQGGPHGGGGGHGGNHGGGHGGNNPHNPPPGSNNHHYVVQTPCGAVDLYNQPPQHGGGNHQNGDTINIKTETSESIHFLNIPLLVRYQFGHRKFSYFVEGGASLNIVKDDEVKIVVDDSYTENNEHDGLKNISYNLILGAGVQYNFYKGLNMFLNPTFRYSVTPINQDNPMNAYPYYFGLGVGFSIHF